MRGKILQNACRLTILKFLCSFRFCHSYGLEGRGNVGLYILPAYSSAVLCAATGRWTRGRSLEWPIINRCHFEDRAWDGEPS